MNKKKKRNDLDVQIIEMESGTLMGEFSTVTRAETALKKGIRGIRKGYNYAIITMHKTVAIDEIKVIFEDTTDEYLNKERADLSKDMEKVGIDVGGFEQSVESLGEPEKIEEPAQEPEPVEEPKEELTETITVEITPQNNPVEVKPAESKLGASPPLAEAPVAEAKTPVQQETTDTEEVETAYEQEEGETFEMPNPTHAAAPSSIQF